MSYTDQAKLVELFGEEEILALTNLHKPNAITIDATRLTAAIAWSDNLIDSYLGGRYSLPLPSVPLVLSGYAADIARYQLDSLSPRDDVRRRYDDALKWLGAVCQGKVTLGLDDEGSEADTAIEVGNVAISQPAQVFSDQALSSFVDSHQVDRPRWLS